MDPLTHGLLGASAAVAVRRDGSDLRLAAAVGVVAGMLPDLDVLIRSANDPLLAVEYHRHFTHSFAFQPVTALLACGIVWLVLRAWTRFRPDAVHRKFSHWLRRFYLPALLAALTHPINDAMTSYGTRVWWPFSDARVAWDLIAVIDPLFTIGLLAGVSIAVLKGVPHPARWGLVWAVFYAGLCWVQQSRATDALESHLSGEGETIHRLSVKPSIGNILLWRGIYKTDSEFRVVSVRLPPFASASLRPGESLSIFTVADLPGGIAPGSIQYIDIGRFAHFSDGWVAFHPSEENVLVDARYSILPWEMEPLWGIRLNPEQPEDHADWVTFRNVDRETRQAFFRELLRGK